MSRWQCLHIYLKFHLVVLKQNKQLTLVFSGRLFGITNTSSGGFLHNSPLISYREVTL